VSCSENQSTVETPAPSQQELDKANAAAFHNALRGHLEAVQNKDLKALKKTMAPDGTMHLIRPLTPVVYDTESYLHYHKNWFKDENWTVTAAITDSEVGKEMGMAVVDLMYKEAERDGKPYWHQMTLSFGLKKYDDQWYVISDHSSSVKKSAS